MPLALISCKHVGNAVSIARHSSLWCLCKVVSCSFQVGAIRKVAHVRIVHRLWQRWSSHVHVWLHPVRVVQSIACCVHGCAIWEVANRVVQVGSRQWRPWCVRIWLNPLGVVDAVSGHVHRRAIWQVAYAAWSANHEQITCCKQNVAESFYAALTELNVDNW